MVSIAIVLFILLGLTSCTEIQGPEYPPLLQSATGKKIKTIEQWGTGTPTGTARTLCIRNLWNRSGCKG